MDRRWAIAALLVGALAITFVATREPELEPEAAIRAALERAARAASEKNLDGTIDLLSERFKGPSGIDRSGAKRIVFVQLRQGDWSRVFFARTSVELLDDGKKAKVVTHAVLARGKDVKTMEDVLPTSATVYRFELDMEREDDDYRVVHAEYGPAKLLDLK
ncbi:MAG: hypothetical protein HYV07_25570 [Deltaproteobacteria bacterium]|nr:hypothetical protein [Deltaproteobacteria bacterium]